MDKWYLIGWMPERNNYKFIVKISMLKYGMAQY